MQHDLLIQGGAIYDGSGAPGFRGDIAVQGGKIVAVGKVSGEASQVIDADGLAEGVYYTVVNGTVLTQHGAHTGAYPERVLRT